MSFIMQKRKEESSRLLLFKRMKHKHHLARPQQCLLRLVRPTSVSVRRKSLSRFSSRRLFALNMCDGSSKWRSFSRNRSARFVPRFLFCFRFVKWNRFTSDTQSPKRADEPWIRRSLKEITPALDFITVCKWRAISWVFISPQRKQQ